MPCSMYLNLLSVLLDKIVCEMVNYSINVCGLSFLTVGMNKMVINHLEKLFVTNDAATILRELEVTTKNETRSSSSLLECLECISPSMRVLLRTVKLSSP